ncbi:hypothetical protein [Rhizorhabdus histidinilytica]|uniref:hypothetical protein n=1 Tax=Rhizorhabdus histidinilytica TaxID=439228 RepID=UPI00321F95B3
MNAPTKIESGTDIALAVTNDPGIVLLDTEKFDAWYDSLKAKAPADADVSTKKGRDALRSYAAEVRSEKAAIDKARLRLTKDWRDMVDQCNAAGKIIVERLETLAAEVRKPLTDWEEAEKARVAECEAMIARIKAAATVTIEDTAETVRVRGSEIYGLQSEITVERYQDRYETAMQARSDTIGVLKSALDRLTREEAERAELERLRAEAAERERVEAEKRAAEEAERERAEQERIAEERRIAAEQAEAERIERVKREAAEAERLRVEREHQEALAAERRRAEEAEAAAQAERDRVAAEQRAREQEEARVAAEQARREADQAHRTAVKSAAKTAIMSCGADEETARKIVMAIIAGEVPAVKLEF